MSEAALRRMTVDEFLVWDDGTDTRYELIDGTPVAMAPTSGAHQIIAVNIGGLFRDALRDRPPCSARAEAGILKPGSLRTCFQADVAVTCRPHRRGEHAIPDPLVIVEILSPSTATQDRKVKLPVYRTIASVQEIVLIDAETVYCEVHRRLDGDRWQTDLLTEPDAVLRLAAIDLAVPLAALYANVDLDGTPASTATAPPR